MEEKMFTPGGMDRLQATSDRENIPYPRGDGKVKLVNTEWLDRHLHDEDLTIIDVQPNIHDYIQEHIPGAVHLTEGVLRVSNRGFPGSVQPERLHPGVVPARGYRSRLPGRRLHRERRLLRRGRRARTDDDGLQPGEVRPQPRLPPRRRN